jgi:hypothetical protein
MTLRNNAWQLAILMVKSDKSPVLKWVFAGISLFSALCERESKNLDSGLVGACCPSYWLNQSDVSVANGRVLSGYKKDQSRQICFRQGGD